MKWKRTRRKGKIKGQGAPYKIPPVVVFVACSDRAMDGLLPRPPPSTDRGLAWIRRPHELLPSFSPHLLPPPALTKKSKRIRGLLLERTGSEYATEGDASDPPPPRRIDKAIENLQAYVPGADV